VNSEREHGRATDETTEAAIDRLLRVSSDTSTTGSCLDAETTAAWAEGRLLPREVTAVEAHVSTCSRCQELIALVARTTPAREAADIAPGVTRWRLGWLVPLGAAAAALVVWVAVGRDNAPMLEQQTAEQRSAVPLPREEPPQVSSRDERALTDKASAAESPSGDREKRESGAPASAALQKTDAPEVRQESADVIDSKAKEAAGNMPAAAAPVAARSRADVQARTVQVAVEVASPDNAIRWRAMAGSLQRSVDGGQTWSSFPIDPGIQITAGASPTPTVCWFVGRGGVVMLSTDGMNWRRLQFPALTDLVSLRTSNAQAATIAAADGQTFETTDGGRTWR